MQQRGLLCDETFAVNFLSYVDHGLSSVCGSPESAPWFEVSAVTDLVQPGPRHCTFQKLLAIRR